MPSLPARKTVLFIHNGAPFAQHIQHLTDGGFAVTEAHADHAVAFAKALQPDLVILDFDCDGDVTRQLKGDAETKHIPVMALVEMLKP